MTWDQDGERFDSVGANADLQPARRAVEDARSEIQGRREQAVADRHGEVGCGHTDLTSAGKCVMNAERKIIGAVGRRRVGPEPSLIRDGSALGSCGRRPKKAAHGNNRGESACDVHKVTGWNFSFANLPQKETSTVRMR